MMILLPFFTSAMGPPMAASGPTWPMQKPYTLPEKAGVGDQCQPLAHARARDRRSGGKRLAPARAALPPFVITGVR
jgi:hypothetical protein